MENKVLELIKKWEGEIQILLAEEREEAAIVALQCLNDLRLCAQLCTLTLHDLKYPDPDAGKLVY